MTAPGSALSRAVSIPPRHTLPAALAPVADRCVHSSASCSSSSSDSSVSLPCASVEPRRRSDPARMGGGAVGGMRSRLAPVPVVRHPRRHKFEFSTPQPGMCDVVEIQRRVVRSLNNPRQQLRQPPPSDSVSVASAPPFTGAVRRGPAILVDVSGDGTVLPRLQTLLVHRSAALPRLVYLHGEHHLRPTVRTQRPAPRWTLPQPDVSMTTAPTDDAPAEEEEEKATEKEEEEATPEEPEVAEKTTLSATPPAIAAVMEAATSPSPVLCETPPRQPTPHEEFFAVLDHGFSPVPSAGSELVVRRQGSSSYDYLDALHRQGRLKSNTVTGANPTMFKQSEYNMYQHRKYTRMVPANRTAGKRHVRFQEPQVMRFLNVDVA